MNPSIVIGIEGLELTASDEKRLESPLVAGVILFSRNYESPTQLQKLTQSLKQKNPNFRIMVDQEGGRVMRFREGFSAVPPMSDFGKLLDDQGYDIALAETQRWGALMAAELRACGVDLSLSPVVDLGVNQEVIGNRAFHTDPYKVTVLARAWIAGMRQSGMQSVLKHFPGHGSVQGDTHRSYLKDSRPLERLMAEDLPPFEQLIRSGDADFVMVNHVIYPAIDPLPAGFSPVWIRQILRERLNFQGVVMSDDLGMQAAKLSADPTEPVRSALQAGCDLVLLCNEFEVMNEVLRRGVSNV